MPERAQDRLLPAHGRFHCRVIEDIAFGDAQVCMLDLQPGGIADERRDLVALRERLLDKLSARPAGRADDQQPQRLARRAQGAFNLTTNRRPPPEQRRKHQRIRNQNQEKDSEHRSAFLSVLRLVWEI